MHGSHTRLVLGLHRTRLTPELLRAALAFGVRTLDTAPHYQHGTAHQQLADTAGNLLARFAVCTKIGYHHDTATGTSTHSLDPRRLRRAANAAARTLGRAPAVLWLHNPERSLAGLPVNHAAEHLAQAAEVLAGTVQRGGCRSWGIATWNPELVWPVVAAMRGDWPRPELVMTRSGLLAPPQVLTAAEHLRHAVPGQAVGHEPVRRGHPGPGLAPGRPATIPDPRPAIHTMASRAAPGVRAARGATGRRRCQHRRSPRRTGPRGRAHRERPDGGLLPATASAPQRVGNLPGGALGWFPQRLTGRQRQQRNQGVGPAQQALPGVQVRG